MKRVPLTPSLASQWSMMAHAIYLDCLMSESMLSCEQIAFHGGTSLHLSWRSPRYSEDLDFLLSTEVSNLEAISAKVLKALRERFLAIDPHFMIEIRDKTRNADRMPVYHIVVSHPAYIGNAMVKAEFWRVSPAYLAAYPTEFRTPAADGDLVSRISNPVPAAKLSTAYCDKLTAFATRPHLKWRDIYDLWWIGTQSGAQLDMEQIKVQFLHNLSAYTTRDNLAPAAALRLFLQNPREAILASADPDLKRWLPEGLWQRLNPVGVTQMVDYVYEALEGVASALEEDLSPVAGVLA